MNLLATEIIAQRVFSPLYVYLDCVFLVVLAAMLFFKKRYLTLLFGLFGAILYFIVDYGIFHLALHTRSIEGGDLFWVLLWMSVSYGFTNFVWIWLCFSKDSNLKEWIILIVVWWISAPLISSTFSGDMQNILIQRTTGSYHGFMAIILILGYLAAIVYNLFFSKKEERFPLLLLLITGISVQFGWEAGLLIGGIRSAEILAFEQKIMTLVVNSLVETNLGAVPIYCIFVAVTSRLCENLKKRDKVTFKTRMAELNQLKFNSSVNENSVDGN